MSGRQDVSTFFFFISRSVHTRDPHSFPTRRSSDLIRLSLVRDPFFAEAARTKQPVASSDVAADPRASAVMRSEEHTSELQSRLHLVCRLLLEKKKHNTGARQNRSYEFLAFLVE